MVSFRKLSKGAQGGGTTGEIWILGEGGHDGQRCDKVSQGHLGDQGMLECVCVQGFI